MSHLSMFVPTKATVKLANVTWDTLKELVLFYVVLITLPLYIWWDQFIIIQVTLPTLFNWVPSNFMLLSKMLYLNLLIIVTLFTLKVILGINLPHKCF